MSNGIQSHRVRFGPFEANLSSCELFKSGIRIRVQDQPFQILAALLERPGELVLREELRRKLWADNTFVDFDAGLNAAVRRLRDALNDSSGEPRYVETLPRHGYRFIASIEPVPAAEASTFDPVKTETHVDLVTEHGSVPGAGGAAAKKLGWHWKLTAGAAILVMAIVGISTWRSKALAGHSAVPIRSIAVLPLLNFSKDTNQDYFADGMTDALISNLARINSLRVISRSSAMPYKGTSKSLAAIAQELKVDAFVEGSVVRSGNRVRVNAELVQALPERHLWANTYERDLADVVTLQGEVARAIAAEIQIKLTPQEHTHLTANRPVNPAAYEACLKGRYFLGKRSLEAYKDALQSFEQAIQRDPTYAPAYAGLADSYNLLGLGMGPLSPKESANRARAAAKKAIELDDSLADGHASLAFTLSRYDWDWAAADKEGARARELGTGQNDVWHVSSIDSGVRALSSEIAGPYFESKKYDQGIEAWRKAIDLVEPNSFRARMDLAGTCLEVGRYKDAITEYEKVIAVHGRNIYPLARLGYAYALAGRTDEAAKILDELNRQRRPGYSSFASAQICFALGRKEDTFKWLRRAYDEHAPLMAGLDQEPAFTSLHSDSRFKELVLRVGRPNPTQ